MSFLQSVPSLSRVALYAEAQRMLGGSGSTSCERRAGIFRASLIVDLACEQEVLRMEKKIHALTEDRVTPLLPQLGTLCAMDSITHAHERGRLHLRFSSRLESVHED